MRAEVAVVGSGPAGFYVAEALLRSGVDCRVDLYERLPAPYGLVRYGVAPDHPRIKGIVNSLHEMLDAGSIRFIGNVEVGRDIAIVFQDALASLDPAYTVGF